MQPEPTNADLLIVINEMKKELEAKNLGILAWIDKKIQNNPKVSAGLSIIFSAFVAWAVTFFSIPPTRDVHIPGPKETIIKEKIVSDPIEHIAPPVPKELKINKINLVDNYFPLNSGYILSGMINNNNQSKAAITNDDTILAKLDEMLKRLTIIEKALAIPPPKVVPATKADITKLTNDLNIVKKDLVDTKNDLAKFKTDIVARVKALEDKPVPPTPVIIPIVKHISFVGLSTSADAAVQNDKDLRKWLTSNGIIIHSAKADFEFFKDIARVKGLPLIVLQDANSEIIDSMKMETSIVTTDRTIDILKTFVTKYLK